MRQQEMSRTLQTIGSIRSLYLMNNPETGAWFFKGLIPFDLTEEYRSGFTVGRKSIVFWSQADALAAAARVGAEVSA